MGYQALGCDLVCYMKTNKQERKQALLCWLLLGMVRDRVTEMRLGISEASVLLCIYAFVFFIAPLNKLGIIPLWVRAASPSARRSFHDEIEQLIDL